MALELIRGRIADLQISKGFEDFVFTDADKNMVGGAAIGAAAMGQFFNSATLAMASSGAGISMDCFTCLVDDKRLAGRFYKAEFKEGDNLEFVVKPGDTVSEVLAARSPEQRLTWMLPYHECGHVAQRKNFTKWTLLLSSIAASSLVVYSYLNVDSPKDAPWRRRGHGDGVRVKLNHSTPFIRSAPASSLINSLQLSSHIMSKKNRRPDFGTDGFSAGTMLCWGSSNAGQLGDGTTTNSSIPVVVKNLNLIN